MKVTVIHYYEGGERKEFQGSPKDIVRELLRAYGWLVSLVHGDTSLENLVAVLDASQAYTAVVQDSDINLVKSELTEGNGELEQFLGRHVKWEEALAAASFLAGKTPSDQDSRRALVSDDEDLEAAALRACGLDPSKENLEALQAVMRASLKKSEGDEETVKIESVEPLTQDAQKFAEAIKRAGDKGTVFTVRLGSGKHIKGTLLAWDPVDDQRYILKLGSGKQNPAAGMNESGASQAKREVAFSQIARAWGLGEYVPETHLVLVNGSEYAAMPLIGLGFKNLNTLRADKTLPKRLFMLFELEGTVQKWATLDYVLGNVDSHSGNILARGDQVFLIDHGSAFAGPSFSPGTDPYTFTPAYLRALAPPNFKSLSSNEKLKSLPRLHEDQAKKLGDWILGLDEKVLAELCYKYGIDPKPEIDRLNNLKSMCGFEPADLAVNSCWVL